MNTKTEKQNDTTIMTIADILKESGLCSNYIRKSIADGSIPSKLVPVNNTKVNRREIVRTDYETWRATRKNSKREDGRNKLNLYATPEERKQIEALLAQSHITAPIEKPKPQVHKPKVVVATPEA